VPILILLNILPFPLPLPPSFKPCFPSPCTSSFMSSFSFTMHYLDEETNEIKGMNEWTAARRMRIEQSNIHSPTLSLSVSVRWSSSQEVLFFGRRHRSTEEFEFCPSLLCWSMGAKDMARVASGVVFNQVRCALLPYSASNFWLILYVWYLLCCCLCLVFIKSTVNQVSRCRGGWKRYCDGGGVGMHTRLGMIRQEIDMF